LKNPLTETDIAQTLDDVQAALEVIVSHLGLEGQVKHAIGVGRVRAEQARLQRERSLGSDPSGDSRR
jgi:hypothetical protein